MVQRGYAGIRVGAQFADHAALMTHATVCVPLGRPRMWCGCRHHKRATAKCEAQAAARACSRRG
eukprot:scaffold122747_cov48-Phaeocystis_antarctica.AAC.1